MPLEFTSIEQMQKALQEPPPVTREDYNSLADLTAALQPAPRQTSKQKRNADAFVRAQASNRPPPEPVAITTDHPVSCYLALSKLWNSGRARVTRRNEGEYVIHVQPGVQILVRPTSIHAGVNGKLSSLPTEPLPTELLGQLVLLSLQKEG